MSDKKDVIVNGLDEVLDRIKELNSSRELVESKKVEVDTHEKDLKAIETVKGVDSEPYLVKKELLSTANDDLKAAEEKVKELSFKKSELKPVFDELAKKFEEELRAEQEREFHIEIGPRPEAGENDEVRPISKEERTAGRKAFKTLLDYLYNNVNWTAKTAPGLMVLVRNMEENKAWVRSEEFDNVIMLRSSNVLVLWRSIIEDMSGKGYYEARSFLECWANCGKGLSDSVRDIQKLHESTRKLGTTLNEIEDEYERSFDDLPKTDEITTKQEVAPEL